MYGGKKIILTFPNHAIIQLPTTVYYEDTEKGKKTLEQDKEFYRNKNFLLLCRELASEAIASKYLDCRSMFFPDFVFYLKPAISSPERRGGLLLLRTDGESKLSSEDRACIKESLRKISPVVFDKNIHNLAFPVTDFIKEKYISTVFDIYQRHEFVVTDMMHGMIFSVINKIPCIVLDDAIPHKISGYKNLLPRSVKFADTAEEVPSLVMEALREPYQETDLSSYFENFKNIVLGGEKSEIR